MTFAMPDTFSLRTVVMMVLVGGAILMLAYAQWRKRIPFDFWDLLLDPATGKASLDATVTMMCCAVGIWYAIVKAYDPEFDKSGAAGAFLTSLITIMVVSRVTKSGIQAYKDRGAPPPSGRVDPPA